MAAKSPSPWNTAFKSRTDLNAFSDNAIGLFALALRFGIEDLVSVAADAITDGHDDKKCDLVHIDPDEGYAVVAQCYFSTKARQSAPANKASDLNTAVSWLLQMPLKQLPEQIKSPAERLRAALEDGTVHSIHFWYVHNLPESKNVFDELESVEASAKAALKNCFPESALKLYCLEVGESRLDEWYQETQSPILVTDQCEVKVASGFKVTGPDWSAFVTAVPAAFLHKLYKQHKTKLFSANVRDYLGSRSSDSNINNGIKKTAESEGENFWVFNNGLTILVNQFEPSKGKLSFNGISIVNGAQTTGAIGSLAKAPSAKVMVPARFVQTTNEQLVFDIIRYNNSQNKVSASDFRSTDPIQKRLRNEITKVRDARYDGGRRGSHSDAIQRPSNLMPSYTIGQALMALHGDPITAYNRKSQIWVDDALYAKVFNDDTRATHLVFAYSLLRAIEDKKIELIAKIKGAGSSLTSSEHKQIEFFRKRGANYLLVTAIAACLEVFLGSKVHNLFRLSFSDKTSPKDGQKLWSGIVETVLPLCVHLDDAFTDGLRSNEKIRKAIDKFQSLVEVTAASNKSVYHQFASRVFRFGAKK